MPIVIVLQDSLINLNCPLWKNENFKKRELMTQRAGKNFYSVWQNLSFRLAKIFIQAGKHFHSGCQKFGRKNVYKVFNRKCHNLVLIIP